jgi:ATP-binding cassette subfamily C protein
VALRPLVREFLAFAGWRALRVLALMLIVAALEGLGLLLLAPLLGLLGMGGAASTGHAKSMSVLSKFGFGISLPWVLCLYVLLIIVHAAASWHSGTASGRLQRDFVDHTRRRLFDGIGAAEWRFLVNTHTAEFSHALTTDIGRINVSTQALLQILATGVVALAYTITAVRLSPVLALFALAAGALLLRALRDQRRHAVRIGSGMTRTTQRVHQEIAEFLAGLRLAKSSNTEARLSEKFAAELRDSGSNMHEFAQRQAASRGFLRVGAALALCMLAYAGSVLAMLPAATVLALIFILTRLFPLLSELQQLYESALHALPAYGAYRAMWERCAEAAEPAATETAYSLADSIRLQHVCYCPAGGDANILCDINLTLPHCSTTALVGASGAGKSTLADLVAGLLAPTLGRIMIDGRELTDRRAWRESVGYVPQDVYLFNSTLRENLLCAVRSASDAEIWEVLELAAAEDFVRALPEGLDTLLGERGIRLSGGERQRLAIARTLLRKPLLLVLDEATSALDRDNEQRIQDTLAKLRGHLTVLLIAHRETSLAGVDRIARMAGGRIVGSQVPASDIGSAAARISP